MTELHQILAVEGDLKNKAQEALANASKIFSSEALTGQTRRYRPLAEDGEPRPAEDKELAARVADVLSDVREVYGDWLTVVMQKEITNQSTGADVIIDGKVLFHGLPAPALLNLEQRLLELRKLYDAIPTNDPADRWRFDADAGVYVSEPRISYSTAKVPKVQVLYEATKEHPAQVQVFPEDVRVGEWTTVKQSGMISPVDKRGLMERVDKVIRAVKQARQKANNAEVVENDIPAILFDYILGE